MTLTLVERLAQVEGSWLLWKRYAFRQMTAPRTAPLVERRRLARAHDRAQRRYWRRKQAYLAAGGAAW